MSLKQICFVSVFFSDDKDEPADPNIILEEPDDEASKSDKGPSSTAPPAVFPGRALCSLCIPNLLNKTTKQQRFHLQAPANEESNAIQFAPNLTFRSAERSRPKLATKYASHAREVNEVGQRENRIN
jgi:hypothetical protein